MVDSAVILDNIKASLTNLYVHLKKHKIDICLNNVIFKWLVTLFFENTDESIYTPVMDSLLLYGDMTLYKASILILFFEAKNILKCDNLSDASIYFEQNLRLFKILLNTGSYIYLSFPIKALPSNPKYSKIFL